MPGLSPQLKSDKRLGRSPKLHHPLQVGTLTSATGERRGGSDSATQDLFAWGARQKKYKQAGSISLRRSVSGTASPARNGRSRGNRLGQFLYSGSFGRLTPMRQDESVSRNRVVFVLFVLSLVAYVVYHIAIG